MYVKYVVYIAQQLFIIEQYKSLFCPQSFVDQLMNQFHIYRIGRKL